MDISALQDVSMSEDLKRKRTLAVQRFPGRESHVSICYSLGRYRFWLYKYVHRYNPIDPALCESRSTRPVGSPARILSEIEEMLIRIRLSLREKNLFLGPRPSAGRWRIAASIPSFRADLLF